MNVATAPPCTALFALNVPPLIVIVPFFVLATAPPNDVRLNGFGSETWFPEKTEFVTVKDA